MTVPIKGDVQEVLELKARGQLLRKAVHLAWSEVKAGYPQQGWWRRKGTRAAVMWEHSIKNAIESLADDAKVLSHNDTVSLIFDDKVLVRAKKADLELKSKNYPTTLAQLFHEPSADLFGYEGLQRVEIVYVLNRFETAIEWVGIVARDGSFVLWHFELEEAASAVETLPIGTPTPADKDSAANVAKLKKGNSDKKAIDGKDE